MSEPVHVRPAGGAGGPDLEAGAAGVAAQADTSHHARNGVFNDYDAGAATGAQAQAVSLSAGGPLDTSRSEQPTPSTHTSDSEGHSSGPATAGEKATVLRHQKYRAWACTACLLVVIVGAAALVGFFLYDSARESATRLAHADVARNSDAVASTLQTRLQGREDTIETMARVLHVDSGGNMPRWDEVAATFQERTPDVLIVAATRLLTHDERVGYEANITEREFRRTGVYQEITINTTAGVKAPVAARYLPVDYIWPRGSATLYRDTPGLLSQADQGRASPDMFLMGPLGDLEFAFYLSFVGKNMTNGKYWGVIIHVLRLADTIDPVLEEYRDRVGMVVTDVTSSVELRRLGAAKGVPVDATPTVRKTLAYADHTLQLDFFTPADKVDEFDAGTSTAQVIATIIIAVALCIIVIGIMVFTRREEHLVATATVQAATAAHQNVLTYVCHEMRNPLHAILGNLSIAETDPIIISDPVLKECVDVALGQAAQMQLVLNDVLEYRAVQEGAINVKPFLADVTNLFRDLANQYAALVGPRVTLRLDIRCPRSMWVDMSRLRQVLGNALHNAYKYTPPGGEILLSGFIHRFEQEDKTWLIAEIRNTGTGLSAKAAAWGAKIGRKAAQFVPAEVIALERPSVKNGAASPGPRVVCGQRGYNLTPRADRHLRGAASSGVGLPLCHKIVLRMSGGMRLYDDPHGAPDGSGRSATVFWVALPVRIATAIGSGSMGSTPPAAGNADGGAFGDDGKGTGGRGTATTPTVAVSVGIDSTVSGDQSGAATAAAAYASRNNTLRDSVTSPAQVRTGMGGGLEDSKAGPTGSTPHAGAGGAGAGAPAAGGGAAAGGAAGGEEEEAARQKRVLKERRAAARAAKKAAREQARSGPSLRVLLVDDERVIQRLGGRLCSRAGATPTLLDDGVLALQLFNVPLTASERDFAGSDQQPPAWEQAGLTEGADPHAAFDLILLDIVMRRSSGIDVCRRLRQSGCHLPIFAMTGSVNEHVVSQYRSAGFSGLLSKPFQVKELSQLFDHVRKHKGARASAAGSGAKGTAASEPPWFSSHL